MPKSTPQKHALGYDAVRTLDERPPTPLYLATASGYRQIWPERDEFGMSHHRAL